jgi:hypothetical protein
MNRINTSLLVVIAMLLSTPTLAKLYKWTDENGQVHYGDEVPQRYLKQEHSEVSEQGLKVKSVDAAETEAEKAERLRQEQAQKLKEQKEKEQRQRDRVLLDTYTTERDLTAARDARIEAVNSQLQLSESIIQDSEAKLMKTQKLIDSLKAQGKTVPEDMHKKMQREQRQLETHKEVAKGHSEKRDAINTQFDDYILRFRELKADQQKRRDVIEAKRRATENGQ